MLAPKRVKITGNKEVEYYNQFIGQEYDVIDIVNGLEVVLPIEHENGDDMETLWGSDEYEVLEWEEREEVE